MRVVLMGPPGAGKGTQAKRLAEKFGMTHLSSGDILRAAKADGSHLGEKLAEYMDTGRLVPDDIVVDIMTRAITSDVGEGGLLLDGFPRTVVQAEALDEQLASAEAPIDAVAVIFADDNEIVQRIAGRLSCPKCGKVYHEKTLPPAKDNICDTCGLKLIQRDDDKEDLVRQRLKAYNVQTSPVIDYYRRRQDIKVIEMDGSPSPDKVTADLVSALELLEAEV